mgnify:CR=1 FL=1
MTEPSEDRPADLDRTCLTAAAEIDLAAIQTIHAFAGGLLRAYPLEAGLPPGLTQLDTIRVRPVISAGAGIPSSSSTVGARSASPPLRSRRPAASRVIQ